LNAKSVNANENIDFEITRLLKQFKLPDILRSYDEEIQMAINDNVSPREFLYRLLKIEEVGKRSRLKEKNIKNAGFEIHTTFEEFDFKFQPSINENKIRDLGTLNFIAKKENLVFIGPPGVGKSHLSTAIGIRACEQGKTVLFKNAIELVDNLYEAYVEGTLKTAFKMLSTIDLLIIDDLGYLKMNKEKESIFFQLIRQRYEKSSLIITTNLPFNRWDEVFTSEVAATAVLDRILHHCHVISITGNSYRVKNNC
jgi:DNA replication protein DnaC